MAAHIAGLKDEHLQCQLTGRHVPPLLTDPRLVRYRKIAKTGQFRQEWDCTMCGTHVTAIVPASGVLEEATRNGYDHPEGYEPPPEARGVGRKEANILRRREVRLRNQANARALKAAAREQAGG